jgi:hypothetical protein
MGRFADTRRWIKDQFYRNDEDIQGSPKPALQFAQRNLLQMSAEERSQTVQHLNSYARLYYNGRHNERIPHEVERGLISIERRADRLNAVDQAREVVKKYGGPPTKETILDSLHRSYEASKTKSMSQPVHEASHELTKTPIKAKQKEHTHEI